MTHGRSTTWALLLLALPGLEAAAAPTRRPHKVTLNLDSRPVGVAIEANDARVSDVAADLGTRLNAKVVLGPEMRDERITVEVSETGLEMALLSLAPRVLVDYEVQRDVAPKPVGIYLLGATDPAPPIDAIVRGLSLGLMFEGNTEDVPLTPEEDPLLVTGDRNHLSVRSRQQPLALVARAIGEVLGIPVDIRYDAIELVTVNLTNGVAEEMVTALSPNARVFVRVDLNQAERTPLKIVLEKSSPK
jgi:hypothetical protein